MSEPTSPDDAAVGPPEHLHPFFLFTGLGGSLRGMAGGYAAIGYLAAALDDQVERYANVAQVALDAFTAFAADVRDGRQIKGAPRPKS